MKAPSYFIFVVFFLLTISEFKSYSTALIKDRRTEKYSDVQFILSNGEKIKGHKMVFALSSPKFHSIVYGDDEDSKLHMTDIEIKNVEPEAFKIITDFIYSDKLEVDSVSQAMVVYDASSKYELENLKILLEKYINSNIKTDNVLDVLDFSKLYNVSVTEHLCMESIRNDTDNILRAEKLVNCSLASLEAIVNEDKLNIKEVKLFKYIEIWAKHHSEVKGVSMDEIRSLMKNIITQIRFLSMTPKEFASLPGKSELLADDKKRSILMNLITPGSAILPNGFSNSTVYRTQDTFSFRYPQVSVKWAKKEILNAKLDKFDYSPDFYISNYRFYISVLPAINKGRKTLEMYLYCNYLNETSYKGCFTKVKYTFKLTRENGAPRIRSTEYNFDNNDSFGFGWDEFIEWNDLINGGFVKNGSVLIEADVKIEK